MEIIQVNENIYTKEYLKAREIFWKKQIKKYEKENIPLWNGIVYYLKKIKKDSIYVGLCEYKDIIFINKKDIDKIKKK